MTSGTALSLCCLEFISTIEFSLVLTGMAILDDMQTGKVMSMEVWDLVRETMKVRGFSNW